MRKKLHVAFDDKESAGNQFSEDDFEEIVLNDASEIIEKDELLLNINSTFDGGSKKYPTSIDADCSFIS